MAQDALNAICPYYTMYPLRFPLSVLERHGKPGEWVLDPFCGRGTTNFAARLLRMPSCGLDSSPVAAALAKAKLADASPRQVVAAARDILRKRDRHDPRHLPRGRFWTLAYHPETLADLCRLRESLLLDCRSPSRVLLRALLLGALHGPRPKSQPAYFSNQSPRTFAPKPRYAAKFWTARKMSPERVGVLDLVQRRAERYLSTRPLHVEGVVRQADSRRASAFRGMSKVRWVVTSPPYYGMRTYLPDQWLRHWFLGGPDRVVYRQPEDQLDHGGAERFSSELACVWRNVLEVSTARTRMVVRFGGIHDRDAKPMDVLRRSLEEGGWRVLTARVAPDVENGRRQVSQFQAKPRKGIAEHDVYCAPA